MIFLLHKKSLGVSFNVIELDFPEKDHAMLWVLKTQLGRRNLGDLDFKLLIGQEYELEQKILGQKRIGFS
jgi:hypothetical protein